MSLKDALEKAGIKTSASENYRKRAPKKDKTKVEKHQETRIFCEVCEATHQDVERYKHRMPLIDAEWICVNCADKNSIHDDFRVTQQSHASKNGMFQRFYGPTKKDFSKDFVKKDNRHKRNGPQKQNRFKHKKEDKNFNR